MIPAAVAATVALALAGPAGVVDVRDVVTEQFPDVSAVVRIIDAKGQAQPDLRHDDFRITEDGAPLTAFEVRPSFRNGALAVVLVIDTSGSMLGAPIEGAKAAAAAFVAQLGPDDRVAVITFNNVPEVRNPFSAPKGVRDLELIEANPRGETALYDAVDQGIALLASQKAEARALVVLTDGAETVRPGGLDLVVQNATGAAIPIHGVAFESYEWDPGPLSQISTVSKGTYREVASPAELSAVYRRIAAELLTEYRVTYRSTATPGVHRLTIAVDTPLVTASVERAFTLAAREPIVPEKAPSKGAPVALLAMVVSAVVLLVVLVVALLARCARHAAPAPAGAAGPDPERVRGARLVLEAPGINIPVVHTMLIGRDPDAAVIIDDPTVSRRHAKLELLEDGVWVEDLGSSNGTLVNGALITRSRLAPGDMLEIGDQRLWLRGRDG